jgi:hypothetical protein
MKSKGFRHIVIACVSVMAMLTSKASSAQELLRNMVVVQYAFQLEDWKVVGGESYCRLGHDCRLGFDFDPVQVTLRIEAHGPDLVIVNCPGSDSGCEGMSHSLAHRTQWEYITLLGTSADRRNEFVLSPKRRVGAVLLQYQADHASNGESLRVDFRR